MFEALIDSHGEPFLLASSGFVVGLVFGCAAQHSRFCLRSATVEVAEGVLGARLSIWLIVFFSALLTTQGVIATGSLDVSQSRQLGATGSLSGAVIGGLLFGSGMILARGCASRLLVLSGSGNLRALLTGLLVTLVAQASLTGALAPSREVLSQLVTIEGGQARDLLALTGMSRTGVLVVASVGLALALLLATRRSVRASRIAAAVVLGSAVTAGWVLTYKIASASFEIVPIGSVTFTGPSTDTLMTLVTSRRILLSFGVGLVPGVFLGALIMALTTKEWKVERFGSDTPMERYMIGGSMMGFGAMLAGGCAVGAGVTGGAVLSVTAWLAVASMWAGALVTENVLRMFQNRAIDSA